MFNIEQFLRNQGIEIRYDGPGVKSGNFNINCPLCANDTKFFLGVDPRTNFWGCWWSSEHRGRNPAKLVRALLKCSWAEALKITGGPDDMAVMPGSLAELEKTVEGIGNATAVSGGFMVQPYPLPEFREIRQRGITAACWNHLAGKRKFREADIPTLCKRYKLTYAAAGRFRKRIILPLLHRHNAVIGFQARAIGDARLRYITEPSAVADKRVLFGYGAALAGGRTLTVVEGPFDFLMCDFYGNKRDRAVATLGTSFTESQVALLFRLCPKYERVLLMFDPGALGPAMALQQRLARFNPALGFVPEYADDPGDLEPGDVEDVISGCF